MSWFTATLGWMGEKCHHNSCFLIYKPVGLIFLGKSDIYVAITSLIFSPPFLKKYELMSTMYSALCASISGE